MEFAMSEHSINLPLKKHNMSLLNNNNKQKSKGGKKDQKGSTVNSKFIPKPSKGSSMASKPHKTGGTRGS
jgi:hypothetical protein